MFPKMVEFQLSTKLEIVVLKMQQSKYVALHKAKTLWKENVPRQIVEFVQLNTMVTSYNLYFESYSIDKKKMIWLIFIAMWKQIYINKQVIYLDSIFVKKL
jgi:hypothetical protein